MVDCLQIEVAKIPEAGRGGEGHNILVWLLLVLILKLFEKLGEVLAVLRHTTTIICSGVLPVEINTVKCILSEEGEQVLDEPRPILLRADHVTEDFLQRAWVVVRPSTNSNDGLEPRIFLFETGEICKQLSRQAVHTDDIELVWCDESKREVQMSKRVDGDVIQALLMVSDLTICLQ